MLPGRQKGGCQRNSPAPKSLIKAFQKLRSGPSIALRGQTGQPTCSTQHVRSGTALAARESGVGECRTCRTTCREPPVTHGRGRKARPGWRAVPPGNAAQRQRAARPWWRCGPSLQKLSAWRRAKCTPRSTGPPASRIRSIRAHAQTLGERAPGTLRVHAGGRRARIDGLPHRHRSRSGHGSRGGGGGGGHTVVSRSRRGGAAGAVAAAAGRPSRPSAGRRLVAAVNVADRAGALSAEGPSQRVSGPLDPNTVDHDGRSDLAIAATIRSRRASRVFSVRADTRLRYRANRSDLPSVS